MYTFMSINGSSGSCHPRRDAELIPICNRLLTDLHVVRKMKWLFAPDPTCISLLFFNFDFNNFYLYQHMLNFSMIIEF